MSKAKKTAAVIALICLGLGIVLSATALAMMNFDFSGINTIPVKQNTQTVGEKFSSLYIESAGYDIRLERAQSDVCMVSYTLPEQTVLSASVTDGTLNVTCTDHRKWYDFIGIQAEPLLITISLPAEEYENLVIGSAGGDIDVSEDLTFSRAELTSTSGDIRWQADVWNTLRFQAASGSIAASDLTAGALEAHSISGDVELSQVSADDLTTSSASGNISIQSAQMGGALSAQTTSGEIEVKHASTQTLSAQSVSGNVELGDVVALGALELNTTSGDVDLFSCDAATLSIQSTSGEVSGTLLSEKLFITHTTTGNINVPSFTSASVGVCEVTTVSGDIKFETAS